ncbi:uncharacterized protein LY89DRAFT_675014 [Mollisia scopiformis]|uniref:Probable treble clef zinc finger domain-containing protein n=1 Tax=Mollisia scopiformis TaxID=149040 RepID=A0A194WSH5_MOLSC|nr:uncharacterized protein LY89DRAFT_675014 [Mollisia scopiformis]KUJ10915.1 hypothetical protein LY89DRAFT_675014 [Mollisia scopiformis]
MANNIEVYGAYARAHHQTCKLHGIDRMTKCSGITRRGGICANKATTPSTPSVIPTCRIHRDQRKQYNEHALMARQLQNISNGEFVSNVISTPAGSYRPVEPVWDPPINERYFTMIRSFRVELMFHHPINYTRCQPPGSSASDTEKRKALELRLAEYCDKLHKLVGRFKRRPIAHLEIAMKFSNAYVELASFPTPLENHEMEFLFPNRVSSAAIRGFANYLKCWSKDLSSPQPSSKCNQLLEIYWRLESLLASITEHCNLDQRFFQFGPLLQAARIAREASNLEYFKKSWDRVVAIWLERLDDQKVFRSNVTRSINVISSIIQKGP